MFSFLREKSFLKRAAFAALVLLLSAGLLFVSCKHEPDDDPIWLPVGWSVPTALQGTWVNPTYGDETYTITGSSYLSEDIVWGGFGGTIVNIRADGPDAGYITIKYTQEPSWFPGSLGNFYVIHYKNLSSSSVSIAGCSDGTGKSTQATAEAEYTVENTADYFSWYSIVNKIGNGMFTNKMQGTWYMDDDPDEPQFIITNRFIRFSADLMGLGQDGIYVGEIVKVQDNDVTGYIVFKLVGGFSTGINLSLITKRFTVLHWQSYNAGTGTASLAIGGGNAGWSSLTPALLTANSKEEAEAVYINAVPAFSFNREGFTKQP